MSTPSLARLLDTSKALSNRGRVRVLAALEGRELCVGQVAAIFDIARSTASEHLSELRRVGLVEERREGRFVWFSHASDERAARILEAVRRETREDAVAQRDAAMAERILALPHDVVCEKGRAALDGALELASRREEKNVVERKDRHQEVP
jgi:DNA-binding transcriptional ArsR family regulator